MGRIFTPANVFLNRFTLLAFLILSFCFASALQAQVQVTISSTNVTCFGLNNGSATAVASGGWAPYTYLWSNGATTQTISNLAPGVYSVTATDIDLGTGVATVTITQPPQLGVQAFGESQICGTVPDGKATAVPFGGTPPYTYLWSTGAVTPQITGLAAGSYTVTVTDAKGCTAAGTAIVEFWNEGVWVTVTSINVTCFGANNGGAVAMAMSGTPPYVYKWSNGGMNAGISNLAPGTYTVTVTDINGCSNSTSVQVTQPPQLVVTTTSTNAACGMNGSATASANGGTPNFSFTWNTGATTTTITGPAGTYTVTVTDANGCTKTGTATISSSSGSLTVTGTVTGNAGCTTGGSATATAAGGSGNYAYSWDNGQTTATATNLSAGVHKVTVTDIATGCTGVATVDIPSAPQLTASATAVSPANCTTGGSATATGAGGTPPYTYKWDNGQTTQTATNLSAGPHVVTVTDSKGCIATAMVTITQTQGPSVTATVVTNATCTTGGSATAVAAGGTAPYKYAWDNGQTTATATNLSPGAHKVTVTDAGGCSATAMVTITQPAAPTAIISASSGAGCTTGGSATAGATGGTSPYTFKWSNGATTAVVTNLSAGTYTVTVTDAAGCTASTMVSIAAAIKPNVVITASTNANCTTPGSATASASAGAAPYKYLWSNGETTATATNLTGGVFTVTVTDNAGCTGTASVTIGFSTNGIKIGDYVWYDNDQDGFQHPLETNGVPNVTVMLIKPGNDGQFGTADDVTVATTTTTAAGMYMFNCVTPGTYILMFSGIPSGYEFTQKDKVNNDCKDSDAKSNGKTDPFTIVAGQGDNLCLDAGIHTICENVMNAGLVCCDQTICEGQTPALFYEVMPPAMGSGALQYQWLQLVQMGPAPPQWVGITGATQATYQSGPLFETSYFMRCARRAGCTTFLESNIITVTVIPAGTGNCFTFTGGFDLKVNTDNTVQVTWTTANEAQQYYYEVESTVDMQDWKLVGGVVSQNTANNVYNLIDEDPAEGKNYYRIKRRNPSGIVTFSEIKSIDVEFSEGLTIRPTRIIDELQIRNFKKFDNDVTVSIFGSNGKLMETLIIRKGELKSEKIDFTDLPPGVYFVKVDFGDGERQTVKAVKF